eukprot:scaffold6485_cov116-Skeletonema_dohrnii-CCMP3373.AAC.2
MLLLSLVLVRAATRLDSLCLALDSDDGSVVPPGDDDDSSTPPLLVVLLLSPDEALAEGHGVLAVSSS